MNARKMIHTFGTQRSEGACIFNDTVPTMGRREIIMLRGVGYWIVKEEEARVVKDEEKEVGGSEKRYRTIMK